MGDNEAVQRNDAQLGGAPASIAMAPISANWSPEALCIGEKIVSIRQLIKRFSPISVQSVAANDTADVFVAPFAMAEPAGTTTFTGMPLMSMLQYFYYMFGFYRGGMRIKAVLSNDAADQFPNNKYNGFVNAMLFTSADDQLNDILDDNFAPITGANDTSVQLSSLANQIRFAGQAWQVIDSTLEGLVEVEVPYYSVAHITPTSMALIGEKPIEMSLIYRGLIPPSVLVLSPSTNHIATTQPMTATVFRAASDDFSFLYTLGVPQLYDNVFPIPPDSSLLGESTIYTTD